MPDLYHVILRVPGQPDEVRLHNRRLSFGDRVQARSRSWFVEGILPGPADVHASGRRILNRFLCVQA